MDTPKEKDELANEYTVDCSRCYELASVCKQGDQLGFDLAKFLKLPENILNFEIKFTARTPPIVTCVSYYCPEKSSQDCLKVFSEFELVPKDPKPFSPATKRERLLDDALHKIMSYDEDIKEEAEAILNTDFKEYARKIAEEAISKAHEL